MGADRSERGVGKWRGRNVIESNHGEVCWNGKSRFTKGHHGSDCNGVVTREKRGWTSVRSKNLPHRGVAALTAEISLREKLFIERNFCRLKGGAISFEAFTGRDILKGSIAYMGYPLMSQRKQLPSCLPAGLIISCSDGIFLRMSGRVEHQAREP